MFSGERLKAVRESRRMTQYGLAKKADTSPAHIRKLEYQRIAQPRPETIQKLAEALDVSPLELMILPEATPSQNGHVNVSASFTKDAVRFSNFLRIVAGLPPEDQAKLVEFAEFLSHKRQVAEQGTNPQALDTREHEDAFSNV